METLGLAALGEAGFAGAAGATLAEAIPAASALSIGSAMPAGMLGELALAPSFFDTAGAFLADQVSNLTLGDALGAAGSLMPGPDAMGAGQDAYAAWAKMAGDQQQQSQDAINQMLKDASPEELEQRRARAETEIASRGRTAQASAQSKAAIPTEAGAPAVVNAERGRQAQRAGQFGQGLADSYAAATSLGQAFADTAPNVARSANNVATAGRNAAFQYSMAPGAYQSAYTQAQRNPYDLGSLLSGAGTFVGGLGGRANPTLGSFF